jgi:tetratricopeptide (TPR) repeat protein
MRNRRIGPIINRSSYLQMNKYPRYLLLMLLALVSGFAHPRAEGPASYDSLIQKGDAQLQAGSPQQALSAGRAAINVSGSQWEGFALAGGALMNLKRYEEAADALSDAIKRAPESKQAALRDLRRQCLLAETGSPGTASTTLPATSTSQAEIVLWKSIENSAKLADFRSYLDQYPQGAFAVLARRHLTEAKAQEDAMRQGLDAKWQDLLAKNELVINPTTGVMAVSGLNLAIDLRTVLNSTQATYMRWGLNFNQAAEFCAQLQLYGRSGWRLPILDEGTYIVSREGIAQPVIVRTATSGNESGTHIVIAPKGLVEEPDEKNLSGPSVYCVRDSEK